jgi:hypothetical protein
VQVHRFETPSEPGQTHWRFICSDLHLESPESDLSALRSDLNAARKVGARILINGDVFDAIWPGDPRFTMSVLRKELRGSDDVFSAIIEYAAKILTPYADLIDVVGNGNHERALHRRRAVDPINQLIGVLNHELATQGDRNRIRHGGVSGYILSTFRFARPGGSKSGLAHKLLYFHGSGGESPVTKGLINVARIGANFDYDTMTFGHKHNRVFVDDTFLGLSRSGKLRHRQRIALLTGSYVRSYREGSQKRAINYNYAEDFISIPKPLGGLFLSLTPERADVGTDGEKLAGWRVYQQVHTRPIVVESAA